ncbi:MAG: hypothetical protein ACRD3W_07450, partial [Terriglobales bacterium]
MKISIRTTALATILSSVLAAPSFCANVKVHAVREPYGTSCNWSLDPFNTKIPQVRLVSYSAAPLFHGDHCALVANFGDSGVSLREFSFQVHFTPQARVNVRPGVNVQYFDDKGAKQTLALKWEN